MELAACDNTRSAARSRVDAGACCFSMIFSTETAALCVIAFGMRLWPDIG